MVAGDQGAEEDVVAIIRASVRLVRNFEQTKKKDDIVNYANVLVQIYQQLVHEMYQLPAWLVNSPCFAPIAYSNDGCLNYLRVEILLRPHQPSRQAELTFYYWHEPSHTPHVYLTLFASIDEDGCNRLEFVPNRENLPEGSPVQARVQYLVAKELLQAH